MKQVILMPQTSNGGTWTTAAVSAVVSLLLQTLVEMNHQLPMCKVLLAA